MMHLEFRKQEAQTEPASVLPDNFCRGRLIVADWQTVAASTQALVRGVIHVLADEVHATVAEDKLATLRVTRPEAMPEVPVAMCSVGAVRIGIIPGNRFLRAGSTHCHQVNAGRSAGQTAPGTNKSPPTSIPVVRALAK